MIPLSILDLAPVTEGSDAAQTFANTLDLARHAERLGYQRYWLAEHHNMPGIASAATAVLIGHVAGGTASIRVGAGGIMLPNHAPLQVAEQFGTLASLYPGRIDLGLGRAPGHRPGRRARAAPLLRERQGISDRCGRTAALLRAGDSGPGRARRARRRHRRGDLDPRIEPVRRASGRPARPALCLRVALRPGRAGRGARALSSRIPAVGASRPGARHARPQRRRRRQRRGSAPPVHDPAAGLRQSAPRSTRAWYRRHWPLPADIDSYCTPQERAGVDQALACAVVGSTATVRDGLRAFIETHRPDELLLTANVFDHDARMASFRRAMQAHRANA